MRINQFIARASGLSRRAADTAVAGGRVSIDGRNAQMGEAVPDGARVELDNQAITPPDHYVYLLFHKPVGYICSRVQQGDAPTIYELLPTEYHNLNSVGRLDKDSSGLLLLTNDGGFMQQAAHPSNGKIKHYEIILNRPLDQADLAQLAQGVKLEDGPSHVGVVHHQGKRLEVTLSEGRNRQLRRTFAALGYKIWSLHRTAFGSYNLGDLAPGAWQPFEPGEAAS